MLILMMRSLLSKKKMWRNQNNSLRIRQTWFFALKDVDVNSTEKLSKSTQKLAKSYLCQKEKNSIQKQRESPLSSRY